MKYWLHPGARVEHLDHVAFYESRQVGLGAGYIAEFEAALARICEAPLRYPIAWSPDIRRLHLSRYPITILFRSIHGAVQVLALAHKRRRPGYWVGRL